MHAGSSRARGEIVVTMDGDLQNQPEDIPRLVAAVEAGADVASGRRAARNDSWGRTLPSRLINGMLRRFTGVAISDFGCAFNAYRAQAVEPMLPAIGKQKFTKALILSGGASVVEVDVGHTARAGNSRYSPLRLTRLALHVLAGFWPQPIQWIGVALGVVCTLARDRARRSTALVLDRPLELPGPLLGGVAVLFVLGIQGFILALVGEYLGRIQREVEGRPLYSIVGGSCEKSAFSSPAARDSSRRTSSATCWRNTEHEVVSLDALTYAGNLENLADVIGHERLSFVHGDIRDAELVAELVAEVDVIVNAAAESHVEKSIEEGASEFVTTNVEGTQILLDAIRRTPVERFILISSSEVYGTAESRRWTRSTRSIRARRTRRRRRAATGSHTRTA